MNRFSVHVPIQTFYRRSVWLTPHNFNVTMKKSYFPLFHHFTNFHGCSFIVLTLIIKCQQVELISLESCGRPRQCFASIDRCCCCWWVQAAQVQGQDPAVSPANKTTFGEKELALLLFCLWRVSYWCGHFLYASSWNVIGDKNTSLRWD